MANNREWSGHLTSAQLAEFEAGFSGSPSAQKLRELTVAHAHQEGGLTLALLRLFHGVFWGEPHVMTFEQCSKALNVPVSELMETYDRAMTTVKEHWNATPEYQAWKASRADHS